MWIKASELTPTEPRTYIQMGKAYQMLKRYDYALLAYRRAAELEPDNLTVQFNLAELYLRKGREREAKESLEKSRQLFKDDAAFYLSTALMMRRLGRPQLALIIIWMQFVCVPTMKSCTTI